MSRWGSRSSRTTAAHTGQAAAEDARIVGVIAQSAFADLETVVRERAPFIATVSDVRESLAIAEHRGRFKVAEVSPRLAAARVHVPVLVIHGERDKATRSSHARAIFEALAGPKELLIVAGAGHDDTLAKPESWARIDAWLARVAPLR